MVRPRRKASPTVNSNGHHDPSAPLFGGDPIGMAKINKLTMTMNSTLRSVLDLRNRLDSQLDPRRSIDDECGYPAIDMPISVQVFKNLYDRDPIAARCVELEPKESWVGQPEICEDEDPDVSTPFEQALQDVDKGLRGAKSWHADQLGSPIFFELKKADILSRIGSFGLLLIGIDDGLDLSEPAAGVIESETDEQGDSPMSADEEDGLTKPTESDKGLKPNPKPPARNAEGKVDPTWQPWVSDARTPPKLTANEAKLVQRWQREREMVENHVDRHQRWPTTAERRLILNLAKEPSRKNIFGGPAPEETPAPPQGEGKEPTGRFAGGDDTGKKLRPDMPGEGLFRDPLYGQQDQQAGPTPSKMKLRYLRSFDESLIQVVRFERNPNSPRFGLPVMYRITLNDPREWHSGTGIPLSTIMVHWSRVIHLADHGEAATNSVPFAAPVLRPLINAVMDCRKVAGAGPEGYWKSSSIILSFETHPQLGGDVDVDEEAMKDMIEDMDNSLQKRMFTRGMAINPIAPVMVDPTPQHDMGINRICIKKGCPVPVFCGYEIGEQASIENRKNWNKRMKSRQDDYITPKVIAPFLDRLIQMRVLPEPKYKKPAPVKPAKPGAVGPDGKPLKPVKPGAGFGKGASAFAPSAMKSNPFDKGGSPNPQPKAFPPGGSGAEAKNKNSLELNAFPFQKAKPDGTASFPAGEQGAGPDDQATQADGQDAGRPQDGQDSVDGLDPHAADAQATQANQEPGYRIIWPDLDALTDAEQAQICLQNTQAAAAFVSGGVEAVIPRQRWLSSTKFMNMDDSEASEIENEASVVEQQQKDEQDALAAEHGFEPLPPEGMHDPENPIPTQLNPGQSLHDPSSGKKLGENPHAPPQPPAGGAPPFGGGGGGKFPPKEGPPK